MRKLIYGINLSLDGCCDHTKLTAGDEIHQYWTQIVRDTDTLLYGRKTYELMVPFWPDLAKSRSNPSQSINDFASAFDAVKNIVVISRTLDESAGDKKTTILRGDLQNEINKLKQQPGRDILTGGVDIPSQLIGLGLVDEYRIIIQPNIVGEGRRLMQDFGLPERLQLTLAEMKNFSSGTLALRYLK
jgi:dihydrofolate reductase